MPACRTDFRLKHIDDMYRNNRMHARCINSSVVKKTQKTSSGNEIRMTGKQSFTLQYLFFDEKQAAKVKK